MSDEAPLGRLRQELEAWEGAGELSMEDVLGLPESLRQLVTWILRAGHVGPREVATHLGQDEAAAVLLLALLSSKGMVREVEVGGEKRYRIRTRDRPRRTVPPDVWRALE